MRILIDSDGVMSDFVGPVLKLVNTELGTKFTYDDITEWEVMDALNVPPRQREQIQFHIKSRGFCYNMKPYAGVQRGLAKLRSYGEVIAVTSPFNSDYWERERRLWLQEVLGFDKKHIISTSGKAPVAGDFLIDDKTSNVVEWQEEDFLNRRGILMKHPWNADDIGETWHGMVANDWKHLVALIRHHA